MDYATMEAADCRRHGYVLSDKTLGSGTYAKVKLAHVMDRKIGRNVKLKEDLSSKGHKMVAIKIISKRDAPAEYLNKFMPREIDAMKITHKHANLIQLYEFFRSERGVYLVLEYAANGDILSYINDSVLETGMAVPEDKARQLFRQIVAGVAFCHNRNVVHRDLKCENILLDESWNVKLSDFGFACRFPSNRCNMLTTFCGSYAYAAPEILEAKKYDGKLADVWSLGVILYAMVNGRLPFNDQNLHTLMEQTKKKLKFQAWVSKDCIHLVRRLLRQRPLLRMRVSEIMQHPWIRAEPICNAWHEGAAAMYEKDPSFNKKESFTRFMTTTESVNSKQRQDRRAIIKDARTGPAMAAHITSATDVAAASTADREPRRDRTSPTKTPILLADGRIVKRELNVPASDDSRKEGQGSEKNPYGPNHNKYYGANLVTLKKKLAATESAATSPQYATNMRSRMRNLYRRILAANPEGARLFRMDGAEPGKCLVSKKCEPAAGSKVNPQDSVHPPAADDMDGDVGIVHGAALRQGTVLGKQQAVRQPRTKTAFNDVTNSRRIPGGEFDCVAPRSVALSAPPTDNSSLPISAVAVANGSPGDQPLCASDQGDQIRKIAQITAPRYDDHRTITKDFCLSPTKQLTGDTAAPDAAAAKTKMLTKRDTVPKSRIKSSTVPRGQAGQQRSGLRTSDLYSHLQNLPILRTVKQSS